MDVVVLAVGVADEDVWRILVAQGGEVAPGSLVPLVVREGFPRAETEDGVKDRLPEPIPGDLVHLLCDLGRALMRAEGAADQEALVGVEDVAESPLEVAALDDLVDQEASPRSCRRTWARRDCSSRRSTAGGSLTLPMWTA
jgi:hypothetical protein